MIGLRPDAREWDMAESAAQKLSEESGRQRMMRVEWMHAHPPAKAYTEAFSPAHGMRNCRVRVFEVTATQGLT